MTFIVCLFLQGEGDPKNCVDLLVHCYSLQGKEEELLRILGWVGKGKQSIYWN